MKMSSGITKKAAKSLIEKTKNVNSEERRRSVASRLSIDGLNEKEYEERGLKVVNSDKKKPRKLSFSAQKGEKRKECGETSDGSAAEGETEEKRETRAAKASKKLRQTELPRRLSAGSADDPKLSSRQRGIRRPSTGTLQRESKLKESTSIPVILNLKASKQILSFHPSPLPGKDSITTKNSNCEMSDVGEDADNAKGMESGKAETTGDGQAAAEVKDKSEKPSTADSSSADNFFRDFITQYNNDREKAEKLEKRRPLEEAQKEADKKGEKRQKEEDRKLERQANRRLLETIDENTKKAQSKADGNEKKIETMEKMLKELTEKLNAPATENPVTGCVREQRESCTREQKSTTIRESKGRKRASEARRKPWGEHLKQRSPCGQTLSELGTDIPRR